MRFVIKLHKKGGWFVIDTRQDTPVRGPFKSKAAAEFTADRLNAKDREWPDEELLKAVREKYGDD